MDKFDRILQLYAILRARWTPIPLEDLRRKLEGSKSTVLRAIATMKDHLNAPIVFDRERGGYQYDTAAGETYELPGLWFTAHELQALALSNLESKRAAMPSILSRSERTSTLMSATSVRRCATSDSMRAMRASMGDSVDAGPAANSPRLVVKSSVNRGIVRVLALGGA